MRSTGDARAITAGVTAQRRCKIAAAPANPVGDLSRADLVADRELTLRATPPLARARLTLQHAAEPATPHHTHTPRIEVRLHRGDREQELGVDVVRFGG